MGRGSARLVFLPDPNECLWTTGRSKGTQHLLWAALVLAPIRYARAVGVSGNGCGQGCGSRRQFRPTLCLWALANVTLFSGIVPSPTRLVATRRYGSRETRKWGVIKGGGVPRVGPNDSFNG